jgi:glycosyltransferase involved in cell wall biosynthesis
MIILHAPIEIAGQMEIISKAQTELGHPSFYLDMTPRKISPLSFRSLSVIPLADVIEFHYARSLLTPLAEMLHLRHRKLSFSTADLAILKRMGKRIVFHFHGCDVRYYEDGMDFPMNACLHCYKERIAGEKKEHMARLERYADKFVVTTPDLLRFVPDAIYVPTAIRTQEWGFEPNKPHGLPVKVVHSPSHPVGPKGTKYVLEALDPLVKAGKVTLILVQNMSRPQVLETCRQADIAIDQLLVGWYGVFAQEMMALGKPVVCYINKDLRVYQKDLPIISADPVSLRSVIEKLIADEDLRHKKGVEGRRFVERVHDSHVVAKQLINLYLAR